MASPGLSLRVGLLLAALLPLPAAAAQGPIYLVGVLPSRAPTTTRAQWEPFLERISGETGVAFRLRDYREMAEFDDDFLKGVPDFIFPHPVQMTEAKMRKGYLPLVRGGKAVSSLVFVRKESPIKSVKELEGGSLALVGSRNVCSVMVRHELAHEEGISFRRHFLGAAQKVVDAVLFERSIAGATLDSAFAAEPEEKRLRLRILHSTPCVPPHPLAVHPRVAADVREAVVKSVLGMAGDPAGRELLKTVRLADPMNADYDRDYRSLEEIDYRVLSREE